MEINLYQLRVIPLEKMLPKLLEKVLASSQRAVVLVSGETRLRQLNQALWTYHPQSFLPHGSHHDGNAEDQPIWLTQQLENPNGAQILVLTDQTTEEIHGVKEGMNLGFKKCLDVYTGHGEGMISAAQTRQGHYLKAGYGVNHWVQNDAGGWEKE